MSEEKPPEILAGLPRTRPHRRSEKRGAARTSNGRSANKSAAKRSGARGRGRSEPLRQPNQPAGTPPKAASRRPAPPSGPQIVSTVVQAAAELVEIGLGAGVRTVKDTLRRLPRP
jgi:hypothetical protein